MPVLIVNYIIPSSVRQYMFQICQAHIFAMYEARIFQMYQILYYSTLPDQFCILTRHILYMDPLMLHLHKI